MLNTSFLSAAFFIAQGLTAAAFLAVARDVGPAKFGPLLGAYGLATLAIGLSDLGINAIAIRDGAAHGVDHGTVHVGLAAKLSLAALISSVWLIATGLWWLEANPDLVLGIAIASMGPWIAITMIATTLQVPLRARERMGLVSSIVAAERLVMVMVTGSLLIASTPGEIAFSVGLITGSIVALVWSIALVEHQNRPSRLGRLGEISALLRESAGFAVLGLSTQIQRADVALVSATAGPIAAGVFGAPARVTNLLGVIPTAFSQSLFPSIARTSRGQFPREAARGLFKMLALQSVFLIVTAALAKPVVNVALGSEYAASASVLRILCIGVLFASASQPLSVYLQAIGKDRSAAKIVLAAAIIDLVLVGCGAAALGTSGAAWGFVAGQAVSLVSLGALSILSHRGWQGDPETNFG